MTAKSPIVLLIIDGFGYSTDTQYNAISAADAPNWNRIWQQNAKTLIGTSGLAVGLPEGQMGNSEVGHMTLGAGRVVYQNFTRINKSIEDGDFYKNTVYCSAVDKAVQKNKAVHIIGLLSPGGVHSHEDHIATMLELAVQRGAEKVYIHAILDGRDTPPRSAENSINKLDAKIAALGKGNIASICGRFYALDRDNRWDRVQVAYELFTTGKSHHTASTALAGLQAAYARDENDEFVLPTRIGNPEDPPVTMADGDVAIFMNFRPDRARQITYALTDPNFTGFAREAFPDLADFVMTTEYSADIDVPCAFPPEDLLNSFGEVLGREGRKQLRIAETEKYAHVTFFFNGGREAPYEGEDRILVPSPKVATYDLQPEMSAPEVTEKLVEAIESGVYDAIICNYANCDQVGHTGIFEAAVQAVEEVDKCLAEVFAALEKTGGEALVTADHGNVEQMFDEASAQPHTQHTILPVPLVYVGNRKIRLVEGGSLADIAPTLLHMLNIEQPPQMNGKNLIRQTE